MLTSLKRMSQFRGRILFSVVEKIKVAASLTVSRVCGDTYFRPVLTDKDSEPGEGR